MAFVLIVATVLGAVIVQDEGVEQPRAVGTTPGCGSVSPGLGHLACREHPAGRLTPDRFWCSSM